MDCCFNKSIPKTEGKTIILRPTSKTFINGLAPSYETTYYPVLENYISEREYMIAMDRIVDELTMMWPCCFCFTFGYLFCICSVGLSFLCPNFCISEAKIKLLESINHTNENIFYKHNLRLSYKQKCSTSWLQIDILDKEDKLLNAAGNNSNKENNKETEKSPRNNHMNVMNNQLL